MREGVEAALGAGGSPHGLEGPSMRRSSWLTIRRVNAIASASTVPCAGISLPIGVTSWGNMYVVGLQLRVETDGEGKSVVLQPRELLRP